MLEFLKKVPWVDRVIATEKYKQEYNLSIRKMADEFETSVGKVCTDLNLAACLRAYPEMKEIKQYTKAIAYMKKKRFKRHVD